MAAKVKPVPEGYHTVTPYLVVDGAEKVIHFMKEAFGAQPVFEPMMRPDGKVMHAEFKIGSSILMIADASERAKATSTMLHLYVPDVDAVYQKALKAGATSMMEPTNQFYGDRSGGVIDSAGNRWHIGTHVEDVSPAELKKRATEFMKQQHKAALLRRLIFAWAGCVRPAHAVLCVCQRIAIASAASASGSDQAQSA